MKRLTPLVIMLAFAATVARSEPESSGKPVVKESATVALPEFQVTAPDAPQPLAIVLEVPVPRVESLIEEIAPPRALLAAWVRSNEPGA